MTSYGTVETHHATDDPALLADLMARVDDLDSAEEDDATVWESAQP